MDLVLKENGMKTKDAIKYGKALKCIGIESLKDLECIEKEEEFDRVVDSIKNLIGDINEDKFKYGHQLKLKRIWESVKVKQVVLSLKLYPINFEINH